MNIFALAALVAIGAWGVHSVVSGVKKLDHKIAHVVAKPFHHKKADKEGK